MKCIKCAHEYEGKFCPECGTPAEIICPNCNTSIVGKFCTECGYSAIKSEEPKAQITHIDRSEFKLRPEVPYNSTATPTYQPQQTPAYQPPPYQQPPIIINNMNTNTNTIRNVSGGMGYGPKPKSKWVALLLCFFLGFLGAHKFYEGRILLGVVYLFTFGLFGIGVLINFIGLLFKPNPYYP